MTIPWSVFWNGFSTPAAPAISRPTPNPSSSKRDFPMTRRIGIFWKTRKKPSSPRYSGTEYRSFAKTNAAPQKRNGRDCSQGFCSVPIAATNSTSPPARVLRESRITMYAPVTRATEEPAAHTISVKIPCGI